jgi:salicylate hydroxylase
MTNSSPSQLMLKSSELEAWSYVEHKSTSTYANDRVCIMGDGAHISSVWQGAPWVLSTEDAFILGSLFSSSSVASAADVSAVFKAFDAVRRPRCQEVISKSREAGRLSCHNKGDLGWSPDRLGAMLRHLQAPLNCIDLEAHKESALKLLRESLDAV